MTQLPWWLIILLSGLVGTRIFQLAVNLVKKNPLSRNINQIEKFRQVHLDQRAVI